MSIVITVILGFTMAVLAISAAIAIERMATGPSQLDRSIGSDLLIATVIGAVGVWALWSQQDTEFIMVLLLSMMGFTGTVGIARMVGERVVYRKPDEKRTLERPAAAAEAAAKKLADRKVDAHDGP